MPVFRSRVLLLAILLNPCVVAAQTTPSPGPVSISILNGLTDGVAAPPTRALATPVDLEGALSLAEQHNPQLRIASARVDGALAGITTASAYLNPAVSFGTLGYQRTIQPGTLPGKLHGFTLTQPFELPSLRRSRIAAAELGHVSSQASLEEHRLFIRGLVKTAFYDALRAKTETQLARENEQLIEDLLRRIRVQVAVGEASRLEVIRAETEMTTARIQAQSAERSYATALAGLRAAVGVENVDLEPEDELDPEVVLPPLPQLVATVLARHPSMAVADAERRRANANLRVEQALKLPQPSVWVDVLEQPDVAQYRWGLSVPVPLWDRREGPIAEAVAAEKEAEASADFTRLQLTTALQRAYEQYRVAQSQVDMFEDGAMLQAQAAVQAAQAAYQFGERGMLEVLDAQRVLRATRADYIDAQFDRQQALIDLEQLGVIAPQAIP